MEKTLFGERVFVDVIKDLERKINLDYLNGP